MRTIRPLKISLTLALVLLLYSNVKALVPPLPSSYYGSVRLDGSQASPGTVISAWIGTTKYAETTTSVNQGEATYSLNVPGDDPSTPQKEGGLPDEIVEFRIGSMLAQQTGSWFTGTNTNINLTASPTSVELIEYRGSTRSWFYPSARVWFLVLVLVCILLLPAYAYHRGWIDKKKPDQR